MHYAGACRYCDGQGWLCFLHCEDGTIVLQCNECDTTWTSPQFIVGGYPLRIAIPRGRNATREEIRTRGWEQYIAGEYRYHVNKFGHGISAEKARAELLKKLKRRNRRRLNATEEALSHS